MNGIADAQRSGGAISTTSVDETIAELAVEIEAELDDMSALLLAIRQRIRPLLALIRDDGEWGAQATSSDRAFSERAVTFAEGCTRCGMAIATKTKHARTAEGTEGSAQGKGGNSTGKY